MKRKLSLVILLFGMYQLTFATKPCNILIQTNVPSKSDVKTLQYILHKKGYLLPEPTGTFGPLTKAALKKFQKENNLTPSGSFDKKTSEYVSKNFCYLAGV
jgi:peptidoglycan hydrolase-like protein with peptidoglycan-binding domain